MRNFLLGTVSVVALLALAGGAYYFGTQKLSPKSGQDAVDISTGKSGVKEGVPTKTSFPAPQKELPNNVGEQIIAAIKSKNTQALEGYTADMVSVRLEASSCCGMLTKAEAISQLSYLDPATGWDFNSTNPILVNIATAAPTFYGSGWTVGVANNEYVFSFKLDSNNKMDAYNISASYKLLIP